MTKEPLITLWRNRLTLSGHANATDLAFNPIAEMVADCLNEIEAWQDFDPAPTDDADALSIVLALMEAMWCARYCPGDEWGDRWRAVLLDKIRSIGVLADELRVLQVALCDEAERRNTS